MPIEIGLDFHLQFQSHILVNPSFDADESLDISDNLLLEKTPLLRADAVCVWILGQVY